VTELLDADCGWEGVLAGVGFTEPTSLTLQVPLTDGTAELLSGPAMDGPAQRARAMTTGPIELAVRSIALQVAGMRPTAADEAVADECNANRPLTHWMPSSTVGVYRMRLRGRLS
jgi:hypothetical protein